MGYNYTNGDGPAVLIPTEPANSDSIKATCAQSIRQIKAFINDPVAGFVKLAADLASLAVTVSGLSSTVALHTTQIAALSGATASAGQNIFKAKPAVDQDVVFAAPGSQTVDVALGTEVFDPDNNFAGSIFTAPANGFYSFMASLVISPIAGAPTDIGSIGIIECSSGDSQLLNEHDDDGTTQRIIVGTAVFQMTAGQTVKLRATLDADAACTLRVGITFTHLAGYRIR